MSGKAHPPALPPRASTGTPLQTEDLPAYTELDSGPYASLAPDDPRSSSTQSLLPEDTPQHDARRTLLLVYVHGFMGAETSFQSFPLHVHNYLTLLLADSHVVHTKMYPRYKSKKQITFARDDFSRWLTPHESPETDVVLLGHSMGGLLAAEVALMPTPTPITSTVFKHHILGTINFDVPFLGMHHGVVSAGLASIFRGKSPERRPGQSDAESSLTSPSTTTVSSMDGSPLSQTTTSTSTSSQPPKWITSLLAETDTADPNFNPKFNNDVNLPVRKGWNKALHFINKHSDNLVKSSQNLVKSHVEFGSAMADYSGLKARYSRLRTLEDDDESERRNGLQVTTRHVPRVRFVNYYTASTGRPKKAATQGVGDEARGRLTGPSTQTLTGSVSRTSSRSQSPRISLEEVKDSGEVVHKEASVPQTPKLERVASDSASESSLELVESFDDTNRLSELSLLPPIPLLPQVPQFPNLDSYKDINVRKVVERAHYRAMRNYDQAVRHRDAALRDRAKLKAGFVPGAGPNKSKESTTTEQPSADKGSSSSDLQQRAGLASTKGGKEEEDILARYRAAEAAAMAAHRNGEAIPNDRITTAESSSVVASESEDANPSVTQTGTSEHIGQPDQKKKKKKDRKFCRLPNKNAQGERDPTWVRIFMKDIDEVTAHCALFTQEGETYETLVGEVGQRIEDWVRDDMTRRAVEAQG